MFLESNICCVSSATDDARKLLLPGAVTEKVCQKTSCQRTRLGAYRAAGCKVSISAPKHNG